MKQNLSICNGQILPINPTENAYSQVQPTLTMHSFYMYCEYVKKNDFHQDRVE